MKNITGLTRDQILEIARLEKALDAAWDLLSNSDVQYMICNGGQGNLGESARYHEALKIRRACGLIGNLEIVAGQYEKSR